MSDYKHRMSLAVPQELMTQANNLALIAGLSAADINTFTTANWQDADGNLYAVCSTVIKPVVLGLFGISLTDITLPAHAINADVTAAQQALDKVVIYSAGLNVDSSNIFIAIDVDPTDFFEGLGLIVIEQKLVEVQ